MDDGFLPASRLNRGQRRRSAEITNRKLTTVKSQLIGSTVDILDTVVSQEALTRRVTSAVTHLQSTDYFQTVAEILLESGLTIEHLVCYGLGTFTHSPTARYQLALLVLLQRKLGVNVDIFDPTFTPTEVNLLTKMGFTVVPQNEEGSRVVNTPTLFYMPHAPHQLVNNLLYANWSPTSLTKVMCFCNSFSNLRTTSSKWVRAELEYISRTEPILVEYPIPNSFSFKDIFNDLALHIFPINNLKDLHTRPDLWVRSRKPTYDQLEFIPAQITQTLELDPLSIS